MFGRCKSKFPKIGSIITKKSAPCQSGCNCCNCRWESPFQKSPLYVYWYQIFKTSTLQVSFSPQVFRWHLKFSDDNRLAHWVLRPVCRLRLDLPEIVGTHYGIRVWNRFRVATTRAHLLATKADIIMVARWCKHMVPVDFWKVVRYEPRWPLSSELIWRLYYVRN